MSDPIGSENPNDKLLIVWLVTLTVVEAVAWLLGSLAVYAGGSGWWFVIPIMFSYQPTLFKALEKRFGVE